MAEALTSERLFADVRHESHETSPLDGVFHGALKSSAVAATLSAEELALTGAEFLEPLHVFVIDISRTRAPFTSAKPATVLATASQFLPNHEIPL
jgi:hypothetical protein